VRLLGKSIEEIVQPMLEYAVVRGQAIAREEVMKGLVKGGG
jgi:hypothetical protein